MISHPLVNSHLAHDNFELGRVGQKCSEKSTVCLFLHTWAHRWSSYQFSHIKRRTSFAFLILDLLTIGWMLFSYVSLMGEIYFHGCGSCTLHAYMVRVKHDSRTVQASPEFCVRTDLCVFVCTCEIEHTVICRSSRWELTQMVTRYLRWEIQKKNALKHFKSFFFVLFFFFQHQH